MRIVRYRSRASGEARGMVVALGNFDGVHRGHQAVFAEARARADALGCPFGVVTFEPHPRAVLRPELRPFRLTPFRTKVRAIATCGAQALVIIRFDKALAARSAGSFVSEVLVNELAVAHVVIGHDFKFGRGREGTAERLDELAREHGFGFTQVSAVGADDRAFASTAVRVALGQGDVTGAAAILGRWWEVEDRVSAGERIGRTIGYPTANLALTDTLHPAHGIYAVWAGLEEAGEIRWHPGAANFGTRPTFDDGRELLEIHLLDFRADLYGRRLRVRFVDYLRAEEKFESVEALIVQMDSDCVRTREILATHGPDRPAQRAS
jgi:riboflavin kinase/FMN adenylyltransferase